MLRATAFVVFLSLFSTCACYKILGVFFSAAPSSHLLATALMRGIADAGHDATLISCFDDTYTPKNGSYRVIHLKGMREEIMANMGKTFGIKAEEGKPPNIFDKYGSNPYFQIPFVAKVGGTMTEATLKHDAMQKLIHSGEKFDVVIIPQFTNDAMKALAPHFGAHLVTFNNIGLNSWVNDVSGNPSSPSYAPDILLGGPIKMDFFQRLNNAIFTWVQALYIRLVIYPSQNELIKKYIPTKVDLYDVLHNSSFYLINSHVSITHSLPHLPNMAFIGGYHVKPPQKLPEDLQKFMDEATNGVVYFSMGSNLRSNELPEEKRNALLKVFGRLKQKVLWKWEDETLPGQPENVKLSKWLPQSDILAHPNIKAFITHGGYGSTIETLYHGVPVVAIPILGDQKANARNAQELGYGIVLPFETISEETVSKTLNEILNNPRYMENAKHRSALFRDRQVKPLDEAVYWLEYVAKYNGARHLRVVSLDLAWYQYYLLDIAGFFLLLAVGSWYLVFKWRR